MRRFTGLSGGSRIARWLAFLVVCAILASQRATQVLGSYDATAWDPRGAPAWQHVCVAVAVLVVYTGGWQVWARVRVGRESG